MSRIYLASSWRNWAQPIVVDGLREAGHEVYDFRNPAPGDNGFHWSAIDEHWQDWSPEIFRDQLTSNPICAAGFNKDKAALDWCDICVLLLPCGRSAHLELGYAIGQGKGSAILYTSGDFEPELMNLLADFHACSMRELLGWLELAING